MVGLPWGRLAAMTIRYGGPGVRLAGDGLVLRVTDKGRELTLTTWEHLG